MSRVARVIVAAVLCAVAFLLADARAEQGMHHHALLPVLRSPRLIVVRGAMVDDPEPGRFDTTALLRVATFAFANDRVSQPLHRTLLLHASSRGASELAVLAAGDEIEAIGRPRTLAGFDARTRWQHAVARLDVDQVLDAHRTRSRYMAVANSLRSVIERGMAPLDTADHALLDGFLLGDTRAVDDRTVHEFRASGLSHLLAVSGANVAFVLALVAPLQRRLPTAARYLFGMGVVLVFAAMTRFEPSVLRASAMALVVMTARASGRPVHALRSLGYAVIALLLIDPFLLHSVGFKLSAAACAGIAVLARPIERRAPGPEWMRTVLAVTIAAQIGVAPVLFAVFGSVAWIAPATNLLAVPAAEPITVLAIPVAVVGAWQPRIVQLGFVPVRMMLWWTREVAHLGARVPILVAGSAVLLVAGATWITRPSERITAVASPP